MIKSHLQLNDADRSTLESLVNKNSLSVKVNKGSEKISCCSF